MKESVSEQSVECPRVTATLATASGGTEVDAKTYTDLISSLIRAAHHWSLVYQEQRRAIKAYYLLISTAWVLVAKNWNDQWLWGVYWKRATLFPVFPAQKIHLSQTLLHIRKITQIGRLTMPELIEVEVSRMISPHLIGEKIKTLTFRTPKSCVDIPSRTVDEGWFALFHAELSTYW